MVKKETVLITGASSGIGEEIARILSQDKFDLILVSRNKAKLNRLKKEFETNKYNPKVTVIEQDLSEIDSAEKLHSKIKKSKLKVDILVNNAGFGLYGEVKENNLEELTNMINLNVTSLVKLTRLFLADMLKEDKGLIVNVASTAAFQPLPYMAAYGATKSFVLDFSEAINEEIETENVSISTLCPGLTKTNFDKVASVENGMFEGKGVMSAKEVAQICFDDCIINRKRVVVCGAQNKVGAAAAHLVPKSLSAKIAGKIMRKK